MRGPTLDARLEAIAGKPAATWRSGQPWYTAEVTPGGTLVFWAQTGIYGEYLTDSFAPRHYLWMTSDGQLAGSVPLRLDPPAGGSISYSGFSGPLQIGLGGRQNGKALWTAGGAAIALYPHALTDYQIQRVITFLMRELKHET